MLKPRRSNRSSAVSRKSHVDPKESKDEAIKPKRAGHSKKNPAPKKRPSPPVEKSASKKRKPSLQVKKHPSAPNPEEKDVDLVEKEVEEEEDVDLEEEEGETHVLEKATASMSPQKKRVTARRKEKVEGEEAMFLGDPIPEKEAKMRWPVRYKKTSPQLALSTNNGQDIDDVKAKRHYTQARVDGCTYDLFDSAYVLAGEGQADYICQIVEFFESHDNELYFSAQWFFRPEDTVIKNASSKEADHSHDDKRVFLSEEKNDNKLYCLIKKIKIVHVAPNFDLSQKRNDIPSCDLYYDMSYSIPYCSFADIPLEGAIENQSTPSSSSVTSLNSGHDSDLDQGKQLLLLDLYSGCGTMSTGLCLGAKLSGVDLLTRWAVDLNPYACESLKINHPETEVRNEPAQDFLSLLREWKELCSKYSVTDTSIPLEDYSSDDEDLERPPPTAGVFEVGKIVGICYVQEIGIHFNVRWKGYGAEDDTWEPINGLGDCEESIEEFVRRGYNKNILPLPGKVDVVCGGPPCQGISGFNRFRNYNAPLEDDKNKQLVVFMEIIDFLKPKYVLMENVVDILKFAKGFLGRYALSRLISMNYQARLGIMAAGAYGLPQFRMRVFLWGVHPSEKLPQFPLPTHNVVLRGGPPVEFQSSLVAYEENQARQLKKELVLSDAISDLPPVENDEERDEMEYGEAPKTEFQRYIRLSCKAMMSSKTENRSPQKMLLDHRPLKLNDDDYQRVCAVPKRKGANFRDLPGVLVDQDNKVYWDPNIDRVYLPSKKPLVPDYAMTHLKGKSTKCFGRLWWDETVPTVVTRAEPHNQVICHPQQDRVLSIRENARLQGFPDYYKFVGPLKERYIQIGNAVAVPVSRALGYAFGQAVLKKGDNKAVFVLPPEFPDII